MICIDWSTDPSKIVTQEKLDLLPERACSRWGRFRAGTHPATADPTACLPCSGKAP